MKTAIFALAFCSALPFSAFAQSGPAPSSSTRAPRAIQHQLQRTHVELQRQRAQSQQLRTRVDELERSSAENRAQQQQRDREIADLQRKLHALAAEPASAASAGGH